ncbi:MAG: hypothetical protein ACYC2U_02525 [Candidatus Amoebophilus sp.]
MLKAKIATIVGLLLIPIFFTSCGYRSKSELLTEERKLVEQLKEQIELTPKQVDQFKVSLEKQKNEESVEDISNAITELETFKEMLELKDKDSQQAGLLGLNNYLQEYIPKLYTIRCHKKARRIIANQVLLLENIKQQALSKYTR